MGRVLFICVTAAVVLLGEVAFADPDTREARLPWTQPTTVRSDEVIVEPGDHLWRISKRHLDSLEAFGPVAAYWRQVITANVDSLRSGDPDLIYPGEVITLPPVEP